MQYIDKNISQHITHMGMGCYQVQWCTNNPISTPPIVLFLTTNTS
uniref:Uncharacterized protein n=1 Tax=Anguilla anguilla TaxID=7936 RepID=A0A0E9UA22_ANGAN